jgi:hypothetical protein
MNEGSPDLGAMVSKLLGNPELLSQIASTVGVDMPPSEDKSAPPEGEAKPTSAPQSMDGILSLIGGIGGGKSSGGGVGRRTALLSALKPFCNEHRCRTIDYMISISKLSENLIPPKRG